MKVIDLLNKIANGEEVPKKIRFDNIEWNRVYGEKNMCYIDEYDNDFFLHFFRNNLDFTLNDEVEIIEKNKNIEHLDIYNCFKVMEIDKTGRLDENFNDISNKINEIIDYINKEDK